MAIDTVQLNELRQLAQAASDHAHCPYSEFPVGAALITSTGRIFCGCNVENASYGLTSCAERTAICNMVAAGEPSFEVLVVYTPTKEPTAPCGACRQVMYEFNPKAEVISVCDGDEVVHTTVTDLLPGAFGRKTLE